MVTRAQKFVRDAIEDIKRSVSEVMIMTENKIACGKYNPSEILGDMEKEHKAIARDDATMKEQGLIRARDFQAQIKGNHLQRIEEVKTQ